jgi:hypothetical protein
MRHNPTVVRRGVLLPCVAAAVLAGCGSAARPPAPPVRLTVDAPQDKATTLAREVLVTGTVSPASATVMVAGNRVTVTGGSFGAHVSVAPGSNVIDVLAGARGRPGAMTAVRVYRQLPVTVPDLAGADPSSAAAALRQVGLRVTLVDVGGFLQSLIPTSKQVCRTEPAAGRSLAPGTEVRVDVAKLC